MRPGDGEAVASAGTIVGVPSPYASLVEDPGPTARAMSTDPHEELFRLLLATAEECPLPVLADCGEMLSTVIARRLHDELPDGAE